MPKRKPRRRQVRSTSPRRKPLMPFSLILPPDELNTLRKIADKEGVTVAAIIRRAIHTVIVSMYPEYKEQLLVSEAGMFLDELATRFPAKMLSASKRRKFRLQLVSGLR